jgi:hypothetical protein
LVPSKKKRRRRRKKRGFVNIAMYPFGLSTGIAASDPVLFPPITAPTERLRSFVDDVFNVVNVQHSKPVLDVGIKEFISPDFTQT